MKKDNKSPLNNEANTARPTKKEQKALSLFLEKFYDLYDEIVSDSFMKNKSNYRFQKVANLFAIYKELLGYELVKDYLKWIKDGGRPIFDGIISDGLFSCIRNIFAHFPVFTYWNEVYIDKDLATWNKNSSIDQFLRNCDRVKVDGKPLVKYRIWQYETRKMTYFEVNLDNKYKQGEKVFLRDIIPEDAGVKFCAEMMKRVVDIAIENPPESKIDVMSQVYIPTRSK